jgi:hypothetical protein
VDPSFFAGVGDPSFSAGEGVVPVEEVPVGVVLAGVVVVFEFGYLLHQMNQPFYNNDNDNFN